MAKKENVNLIETFSEFKDLKSIDPATLKNILEESFRSVIAKMYGTDENYDVIINVKTGDCEIIRTRIVVEDEDLEDSNKEISLSEAKQIDEDYEVGEEVSEPVEFLNFGRRAVLTLRQTLASKILELQKSLHLLLILLFLLILDIQFFLLQCLCVLLLNFPFGHLANPLLVHLCKFSSFYIFSLVCLY